MVCTLFIKSMSWLFILYDWNKSIFTNVGVTNRPWIIQQRTNNEQRITKTGMLGRASQTPVDSFPLEETMINDGREKTSAHFLF